MRRLEPEIRPPGLEEAGPPPVYIRHGPAGAQGWGDRGGLGGELWSRACTKVVCAQGWVCPGLGVPKAGEVEVDSEMSLGAMPAQSHTCPGLCVPRLG